MNRWQGCWLPFVKQRRGGVAGLGDRRGMTTEKKSISTISLSLRWCVVAAAAAARRGNQVFVHLARVFLGAIYSCRRKAAATPQLPLILVWVVYLYVCVCAGRPADLICFFSLLLPYSVHLKYTRPHRRVFIYTLVVEAVRVFCCQRASLFHLDSIAHNTPPLGEAIEGGFSTEGYFFGDAEEHLSLVTLSSLSDMN